MQIATNVRKYFVDYKGFGNEKQNPTLIQYTNEVRIFDGGESMSDCYTRATLSCFFQRLRHDLQRWIGSE